MSKVKCFQCDSDQNDDNVVQCDGCKRNVCIPCSDLTVSEARVMNLKSKRTLLFLCPPCRGALFQVPKLIKSYDAVREELDAIKEKLFASPNTPITIAAPSPDPPLAVNMSTVIAEMSERERRACNVIVVGVPESASDNVDARKTHDESFVRDLLGTVTGEPATAGTVVTLFRLGRRDPTGPKPRPIKIVFKSRQDARKVLKNKAKSRNARIYDDKTPIQMRELEEMRQRLKIRLDKGEVDLTIKFINGEPKIVKQKNE